MNRRFALVVIASLFSLVPGLASSVHAVSLETLSQSVISVLGSDKAISIQQVPLTRGTSVNTFRSRGVLKFPRINLAFSQYVDIYQNQELTGVLNPATGFSSLTLNLWIKDSQGGDIELPVTLTTGVPSTRDCANHLLCFGGPGDVSQCQGTPWDPATGNVKYVARLLVPTGSGTVLDCNGTVDLVINARIDPVDTDGDGVRDVVDTCPTVSNASQTDTDTNPANGNPQPDGVGNSCDNCPTLYNPQQADSNGNGIGDVCDPLRINFQPQASPVPAGYQKDYGQLFTSALGFGWLGGSTLQTRDRNILSDQKLDTFVFTTAEKSWEATLAPGAYDVELAIGDPSAFQGPQRVISEGTTIFNGETTNAGQNRVGTAARQRVVDGRLTVKIGGLAGITCLNYVTATESEPPAYFSKYVNFQPAPPASPLPSGFIADSGALYTSGAGFGWDGDTPLPSRDRLYIGNPVLDTFVYADSGPRSWKIAVPPDYYNVQIGVGDSRYPEGPESVAVEGASWLSGASTAGGEMLTLTGRLLILDGFLDVTIGQLGGLTPLNYVSISAAPRDIDGDGVPNFNDNCIDISNSGQQDADHNGVGDACNSFEDQDGDDWADNLDNCPSLANPTQADADGNGIGDACNSFEDQDGDDWADSFDNCPTIANTTQLNGDGDVRGDACDCAPADATAFAVVGEVQGVYVNGETSTDITWAGQSALTGTGTAYDVVTDLLSDLATQFPYLAATCLSNSQSSPLITDLRQPPAGDAFVYLVRAQNGCGPGSYGSEPSRAALDASGPCP